MHAIPYLLIFVFPLTAGLGIWIGGWATFATAFVIFAATPFLDAMIGTDQANASKEEEIRRRDNRAYDLWLLLWVLSQFALIGWGASVVATQSPTWIELIGMTLSIGLCTGGGGITVAHELMHRPQMWSRTAAEALMTTVSYPHFCVEHVYGHHRNVATRFDPATSRRGESLYRFLPRTLIGSLLSALRIEARRMAQRGSEYGLSDGRVRWTLLVAGYYLLGYLFGGWPVVAFVLAQSAIAVVLLETVNYVEHYGLERKELAAGKFERVAPRHSWNASHRLSNWYLFNLPRHADHHFHASRPYPILRHLQDSPQLPAGYPTMILLALVPPIWKRVMNPRVLEWSAQSVSRPWPHVESTLRPVGFDLR